MKLNHAVFAALEGVPEIYSYPSVDQMARNTEQTRQRYPDLVTVVQTGVSSKGEPIDMISVGEGPMSALWVGTPHPNEAVGCLVIEYLIERLCTDTAFRQALPYRWHFIKTIEPDALRLNEGWLSAPGDIQRYYEHYYRPPVNQQAEYAFPFTENDWLAHYPLAENLTWRNAIGLARPDFLYSLHNSEFGGAFYLLSNAYPGLITSLKSVRDEYGLPVNPVGDTALNNNVIEPGFYCFPDMMALVGSPPPVDNTRLPGFRPVGNSSAGYTAPMGTFSMFTEIPYWDCARLRDNRVSPWRMADVYHDLEPLTASVLSLADRALAYEYETSDSLTINLRQTIQTHYGQFSEEQRTQEPPHFEDKLTWSAWTRYRVTRKLERFSTVGLILQLAKRTSEANQDRSLVNDCRQLLTEQSQQLINVENVFPLPLKKLTQLQLHSGLVTMMHLAHGK